MPWNSHHTVHMLQIAVCANSDDRILVGLKEPWAVKPTRRKTGFQASSLVPGSVSTMVTFDPSDGEQSSEEVEKTQGCDDFTGIISSDASSDYDTELEEDFPGQSYYCMVLWAGTAYLWFPVTCSSSYKLQIILL